MQNQPIPPYKPPPEFEQLKQEAAGQRRRTAVLPKRSWIQRNPRLFQITFLTTSMLIFFSKPLYDGFIADSFPETGERVPAHRR